ncbi:gastrin/cholecystokinin type B receptor-like [Dreissena polymorpha]|uniref:gastrin/cholecystokinin type B receptor-like n=1 Tax=Dreissena polymorpha TaxID=45954 RepID=UPI002264B0D4|nr:gastrin/cholecystokinin type B receptor-like [Dreissena polymorpha]
MPAVTKGKITTKEGMSISSNDTYEGFMQVLCETIIRCSHTNPEDECARLFPELYARTQHERQQQSTLVIESRVVLVILYTIITAMSLVGNSLVIVTFAFDKHMRSVTNVYILSLAVADLMVTLTCVPFNIGSVFTSHWVFGGFACKLVPFFMTFSVACSSLTLCSIAMDRYIAIVHPHKLKCLQNPTPAGIFLVLIWVVSLVCSVPNAVFYTLVMVDCKKTPEGDDMFQCVWPENEYKVPLELWMTLVVLFIVPLVIMSTTYGLIGYQLWFRKSVGSRRNSLRNADMKKSVIKMLLIVMLAFIVCWSPIMVLNSVEKLATTTRHMETLKLYFQSLSMASCCINPVIYTFMNRKFREKFVSYLFCWRKNKVGIAIISKETRMLASENKADGGAAMPPRKSLGNIVPRRI